MSEPLPNPWLHRFALVTALATLALIAIGGLVTSHGAGMAVPDWPNTYGYNMFLFPFSQWVGGILYEHSHRLLAAFVGFLTTILALWLWVRETGGKERWLGVSGIVLAFILMGVRQLPVYVALAGLAPLVAALGFVKIARRPLALRWWGIIAFSAVILQGVLGGLRVVWLKDQIGIFHATLAQLFFVLTCAIAVFTSRWGGATARLINTPLKRGVNEREDVAAEAHSSALRFLLLGTTFLILIQLILGATMRHQHAGLAIPDFPLAYGKIWPPMDASSVGQYNQHRQETVALNPITAFQIGLQMAHRAGAVLICILVVSFAWLARRQLGARHFFFRLALAWLGLILIQAVLGAATILTGKAADIATLHVMTGALTLALGTILCIVSGRGLVLAPKTEWREALTPSPFGPLTSGAAGLK